MSRQPGTLSRQRGLRALFMAVGRFRCPSMSSRVRRRVSSPPGPPWHDPGRVGVLGTDFLDRLRPGVQVGLVDVAHVIGRGGLDQTAPEQDLLVRNPHHDVVHRVPRPEVAQLQSAFTQGDFHPVVEGVLGRRMTVPPGEFGGRLVAVGAGSQLVGRAQPSQAVAVGVGGDDRFHPRSELRLDPSEQEPSLLVGPGRVDERRRLAGDHDQPVGRDASPVPALVLIGDEAPDGVGELDDSEIFVQNLPWRPGILAEEEGGGEKQENGKVKHWHPHDVENHMPRSALRVWPLHAPRQRSRPNPRKSKERTIRRSPQAPNVGIVEGSANCRK